MLYAKFICIWMGCYRKEDIYELSSMYFYYRISRNFSVSNFGIINEALQVVKIVYA